MSHVKNTMNNNSLSALVQQAAPRVLKAIKTAAEKTGVDFAYLVEKASAESSFRPDAKAKGSSASGLYQFIDSTWMRMVKNYGAKYGLGKLANAIDDNGHVKDAATRQKILNLRKDPEKSALFAAEYTLENKCYMERFLGEGEIGPTEMYLAHFMGASGATAFLEAKKENPLAAAADIFPKAARANHNVFYDRATGQPRTLAGVYAFFDGKFKDGDDASGIDGGSFSAQVAQAGFSTATDARQQAAAGLRDLSRAQDAYLAQALGASSDAASAFSDTNGNDNAAAYFAQNLRARPSRTADPIRWNSARVEVKDIAPGLISRPADIMMMARLDPTQAYGRNGGAREESRSRYN
jgi:hypothetical protein